ncbi:MAG TPA: cobalamin biosynthesis protein [Streptosporangiaceae bacterium]|nr:cobalamin biosynthesis protein [Streptosporangiaceae bacterium]
MIGLISVTRAGRTAARRLEQAWPDARRYDAPAAEALPSAFHECDAIVSFLAVGATVRLLAPLLTSKTEDPAVVCVDENLRYAVPVLGAHQGGGNDLARRVAAILGAEPVVTTASDATGGAGLGAFGADLGFTVDPGSDLAAVGAAILSGDRVTFTSDQEWPLPALPPNVVRTDRPEPGVPAVVVTDQKINWNERGAFSWPPSLRGGVGASRGAVFRPPSLRVGVGASRGAAAAEIGQLIDGVLGELGVSDNSVRHICTVDAKADEPGLQSAAAERGWSVRTFPASRLAAVPVPNPSEVVRRAVGTPSVPGPCFYNPASRKRDWQLRRALELLAAHRPPGTPVGWVRDASRAGQAAALSTLACPEHAIRPHGEPLVVLEELCTQCGECVEVCPADAIEIHT